MGKHIEKLDYIFAYKDRTIEGVMEIDLTRFEGQYSKAQYYLDSAVMTDMVPYMPMQTGTFIQVTRGMSAAIAGSGKVVAAAPPMGRFLYEGKVMIGEKSRSAWAQKGEKKVVTDRELQYSTHANPSVQSHWFEAARKDHGHTWARNVKKIAGGGRNG
jgi:hypothetical protein